MCWVFLFFWGCAKFTICTVACCFRRIFQHTSRKIKQTKLLKYLSVASCVSSPCTIIIVTLANQFHALSQTEDLKLARPPLFISGHFLHDQQGWSPESKEILFRPSSCPLVQDKVSSSSPGFSATLIHRLPDYFHCLLLILKNLRPNG